MSSNLKFKSHSNPEAGFSSEGYEEYNENKGKVNVRELVMRLNAEKKREKKSNLALSVAAVSAVTVFGIILSL